MRTGNRTFQARRVRPWDHAKTPSTPTRNEAAALPLPQPPTVVHAWTIRVSFAGSSAPWPSVRACWYGAGSWLGRLGEAESDRILYENNFHVGQRLRHIRGYLTQATGETHRKIGCESSTQWRRIRKPWCVTRGKLDLGRPTSSKPTSGGAWRNSGRVSGLIGG